uniref:Small ribosomal subunit protein bS1c n=1 Tax=Rhodymenia pseudopalmata TaxID=31502 RepID=A0A1C9C7S1_RHOPU|nr:ribosomal protein S1 [Rhodymenia pseudopalmata]AOM64426.1 ribosomal protein S1 [Rhodymenia pseudopalmata]
MRDKIGFHNKEFKNVLDEYNYNLNTGDIVAGTIFNKEANGFMVDIGTGIAGYLPEEEIILEQNESIRNVKFHLINQTREFFILAKNQKSQQLLLSVKRLDYIRGWKRIKQLEEEDIIVEADVYKVNKGGILIKLEGLIGFIPQSHLIRANINMAYKSIKCQLLLANEKKNQLVLSHKRALLSIKSQKLKIGQIVYGEIAEIKDYGIFIAIDKMHALLHISEIGDKHIKNIYNAFHIGQKIKVKIIHMDMKQGRISVSTRQMINRHQQL